MGAINDVSQLDNQVLGGIIFVGAMLKKLKSTFINTDGKTIKKVLVEDVIIPSIKEGLYKSGTSILSLILFGVADRKETKEKTQTKYSYTTGRSISSEPDTIMIDGASIEFPNSGRAEQILEEISDYIYTTGRISVKEYYGLRGADYGTDKYGWTSTRGMEIVERRSNYILRLPPRRRLF